MLSILVLTIAALVSGKNLGSLSNLAKNFGRDDLATKAAAAVSAFRSNIDDAARVTNTLRTRSSQRPLTSPYIRSATTCAAGSCRTTTSTAPPVQRREPAEELYWALISETTLAADDIIAFDLASDRHVLSIVSDTPMDFIIFDDEQLQGYYPDCIKCNAAKTDCTLYCYISKTSYFYLTGSSLTRPFSFQAFEPMTVKQIRANRDNINSGYRREYMERTLTAITESSSTTTTGSSRGGNSDSGSSSVHLGLCSHLAVFVGALAVLIF